MTSLETSNFHENLNEPTEFDLPLSELKQEINNDPNLDQTEFMISPANKILFKQWLRWKDWESNNKIFTDYENACQIAWVKKITGKDMDKLIIKWLEKWWLEIDEEEEDRKYDLREDILNNPEKRKKIDLEKKIIKDFTNEWGIPIKFDTYKDLFEIFRITERIKENFAWRDTVGKDDKPFHMAVGWRIEFNDTRFFQFWKNETDVLKARTLSRTSPSLKGNKKAYINYLNEWRRIAGQYWDI